MWKCLECGAGVPRNCTCNKSVKGKDMFYAIVAWHGLGEFKNATFTQVITGNTPERASLAARVWARTHLDKAVYFDIVFASSKEETS
jgi:hypothetical protein